MRDWGRKPTLRRDDLGLGGRTARQFGTFERELTTLRGSEQVIRDETRGGSHTPSILTGANVTTLRGRDWNTIATKGEE